EYQVSRSASSLLIDAVRVRGGSSIPDEVFTRCMRAEGMSAQLGDTLAGGRERTADDLYVSGSVSLFCLLGLAHHLPADDQQLFDTFNAQHRATQPQAPYDLALAIQTRVVQSYSADQLVRMVLDHQVI